MKPRAIVIVCDSLGVGELPDAAEFGDSGSNTLGHVIDLAHPSLPNLTRLGLLHTLPVEGRGEEGNRRTGEQENRRTREEGNWGTGEEDSSPPLLFSSSPLPSPTGAYGRMKERSAGKDTTTGHWEMMGLIVTDPFRTYPHGFPEEIIREYERRIGRKTLGNKPASGTAILDELGEEHIRTGFPIVYTSGDSVFQVAAQEEVIPPPQLWEICAVARELMRGEHNVGRIIARPFVGRERGEFKRTANRKDFSVRPTGETVLERLQKHGKRVAGVGKIADIFDRVGVDVEIRSQSNADGITRTIELMRDSDADLIFTNLVDFDSKYGHRNDPVGYARSLEELDSRLPEILAALRPGDLLMLSADHGCDPTDVSTDHTREFVPLLIAGPGVHPAALGERETFADLGATVLDHLGVSARGLPGRSVLDSITK